VVVVVVVETNTRRRGQPMAVAKTCHNNHTIPNPITMATTMGSPRRGMAHHRRRTKLNWASRGRRRRRRNRRNERSKRRRRQPTRDSEERNMSVAFFLFYHPKMYIAVNASLIYCNFLLFRSCVAVVFLRGQQSRRRQHYTQNPPFVSSPRIPPQPSQRSVT